MSASKQKAKVDVSKYIAGWEPFLDGGGEIGFTLPHYKEDGIRSKSQWDEYLQGVEVQTEVPGTLMDKFMKLPRTLQNAPPRPRTDPDPSLLDDLIAFIKEHVWISDERYYSVLAAWTVDTWIHEYMETSPRLIFYATTKSGKTRALRTLKELAYHGMILDTPSPAAMYRMIEAYHPALFIDEYQDLGDEMRQLIGSIFKSGFEEGGEVARCDNDQDRSSISFYSVYSPVAIGLKNRAPKEDELNRSVVVQMLTKSADAQILRRVNKDGAAALRGRLLGLRFRVQTGMVDLEPLTKKASEISERVVPGKGLLDDRSIEIAAALLLPMLIVGKSDTGTEVNSVLDVVASSQAFSDEGLKDTDEGRVFFAIQADYESRPKTDQTNMKGEKMPDVSKITTKDVADQFNDDLQTLGDRNERDKVRTIVVTSIIKSLGFKLKRGPHNQTVFDKDGFTSTYAVNLRKYGGRGN